MFFDEKVAMDNGSLSVFDIRSPVEAISNIKAHGKTITGLCGSSKVTDLLLTSSEDRRIKVWDANPVNETPQLVFERKLKMVNSKKFLPEIGF